MFRNVNAFLDALITYISDQKRYQRPFTLDQYSKKVLFVGISVAATFFLLFAMLKFAHRALHSISKSLHVFLHPNQLVDSETKFSPLANRKISNLIFKLTLKWPSFDLTFNESILNDLSWIVFWSSWIKSSSLFLVMSEMSDNWARSNCNMPSSSDSSPQTNAFSILKLASVSSN